MYPPMDHTKYGYTRRGGRNDRPCYADDRHIDVLYTLSMSLPEGGLIVEIGSCYGASTTAYLEAMHRRPDLRLRLYETNVRNPLRVLLSKSGLGDRIDLRVRPCWGDLDVPADLVFIDGHHGWPAVADLALCLHVGCKVVALHDTEAFDEKAARAHHGSILAARLLGQVRGRDSWKDCKTRPGENTDRGFMVSWPAGDVWVKEILPDWGVPGKC